MRPSADCQTTFFRRFKQLGKIWKKSLKGHATEIGSYATIGRLSNNVFWTFQDFFKFFLIASNVQKTLFDSRPTVAWPQPLSRDRSATFFKKISNCLKRRKIVVWQSVDGRVTSDHCRVTVQRLFSNFFLIASDVQKNVVWQSADGRVTSDHCRVTVQRLFSKKFLIAWNVEKSLFDSQSTVAWPPTTVAWPFSDFFQKNF